MKALLVVDWPDLHTVLGRRLSADDMIDLVARIAGTARDQALAGKGTLEAMHVYSNHSSLGSENEQRIWETAGFSVHVQRSGEYEVRERIVTDCVDLVPKGDFKRIIIVCGAYHYPQFVSTMKGRGVAVEVWGNSAGQNSKSFSQDILSIVGTKPFGGQPGLSTKLDEVSGVRRVLKTAIINRTQRQLSKTARQLSRQPEAQAAVTKLIDQLNAASFRPSAILAWTDETRHWNGSLTVAARLSAALGSKILEAAVREEGENRKILSLPDQIANETAVLIVDDAAFSGSTLRMLHAACVRAASNTIFKTAVLSTLLPTPAGLDYYAATHDGTDVLFPWGWARSVDEFYDLLRDLGSRDRRWMPRSSIGGAEITHLTDVEACSSELISNLTASPIVVEGRNEITAMTHDSDDLIYVVQSKIRIAIGNVVGEFEPGEFLYIPGVVFYTLTVPEDGQVLRLKFENVKARI